MAAPAPLALDRLESLLRSGDVPLTHLDRVYFPPFGKRGALLKAHVIDYDLQVAPALLPHVRGRPIVLKRYPEGVTAEAFYAKNWGGQDLPSVVETVGVWSESLGDVMRYALASNAQTLAWFAQMGSIEVHPWLSRVGADGQACAAQDGILSPACGLEFPDLLLFDVDPYVRSAGRKTREAGGEPGVSREDWESAVEAALLLKDVLDTIELPSFPKTSGKRGIHVVVPIEPEQPYEVVRAFALRLGAHLVRARPDLFTLKYDVRSRAGRVFLDCNQNARGKTMVAPYALRPTPQATVSTPLEWDELAKVSPTDFDIESVPRRLAAGSDPWETLESARRSLSEVIATPN